MCASTIKLHPEDFLCAVCKNYLSSAPIYLSEDSRDICNDCVRADVDIPYRNVALEKILVNIFFPCENETYGCTTAYKFGEEEEHRSKCFFKQVHCPFRRNHVCQWNGTYGKIHDHLNKEHDTLITKDAKFLINLNQNDKRTFIVSNRNFSVVDYMYDINSGILKYNIATFEPNIPEQKSTIKLVSKCDPDSMIQVKGGECVSYNNELFKWIPENVIDMNKMKLLLNNPTSVWMCFTVPLQQNTNANLVSSAILNFFKCGQCSYNLKLPIFEQNDKFICNYCYYSPRVTKQNCKMIASDSSLSRLLAKENYQCRNEHCGEIIKGDSIVNHEISCQFRVHKCFVCTKELLQSLAKEHYVGHGIEYFTDEHNQKNVNNQQHNQQTSYYGNNQQTRFSTIFTMLQNEIIYITYNYNKDQFTLKVQQDFVVHNYKLNMELQCAHDQCKLPPQKFVFNGYSQEVTLPASQLPKCFNAHVNVRIYFSYC
ncbi:hypothetical protein RI129_003732 [Pyrocoelia pectoralis]|uniref:SIAH-type domain-containing protein n=1 Tax=Pyrocoelia pectoralis TaxID=417401 RepID=A0AAN7VIV1_9COLE